MWYLSGSRTQSPSCSSPHLLHGLCPRFGKWDVYGSGKMGLGSLRERHTGLRFPPLLFLTDVHGQGGNVILSITVPCCSGSSHMRGRKGHRALKQFLISPSLSLQMQRAIAGGWEGYFRQVLCPTVGAGCGEGPWGQCPVLAPVHTLVHTNTSSHTQSTVQARWGSIKHLAPLECLPWTQAKDSTCPQAPGSLLLAMVCLGEALIRIGNV